MANPANSTAYRGPDGRLWVDVTEQKTLGIADSGYVQNVIYDSASTPQIVVPATATQGEWHIRAGGVPPTSGAVGSVSDASMRLAISPNSADKIQGGVDGTATDDKDIILAKAKMHIGDEITVQNTGETNGPIITRVKVYDPSGLSREP
jgi:hypothetical protein